MATSNRAGNRGGKRRGTRNNNPEGRNQYSGLIGAARSKPLAAAAAIGSAVAAGVFLWSRRNQSSDQIDDVADRTSSGSDRRTQAEIAEEALTLKETGISTPVTPVG